MVRNTEISERETGERVQWRARTAVGQWRQSCSFCGATYERNEPTRYCAVCGQGLSIISVPSWGDAPTPMRISDASAMAYAVHIQ